MADLLACHYLLLTALDDEERALHAALRAAGGMGPEPRRTPTSPTALHWRVPSRFGSLDVLTCSLLDMGQDGAREWTRALLDVFEPRFVGFLGIAGAASDDTTHGTVLIADRVWHYQRAKVMDDRVEFRGPTHISGRYLLDRLKHVDLRTLEKMFPGPPPWTAPLCGTIASGEEVVASRERRDQLCAGAGKLIGVEMEGHSFADEVEKTLGRERWFIVRAVQDRANKHKTDEFRTLACNRAAQFTVGFLLGCDLVLRGGRVGYTLRAPSHLPASPTDASSTSGSTAPEWATALAQMVDDRAAQQPQRYRDGSSRAVARLLEKLQSLIDFEELRAAEVNVLAATAYVAALTDLGVAQAEALALAQRAHNGFVDAEDALGWIVKVSARTESLGPADLAINNVRCHLLAGLLRIGRTLALERALVVTTNDRIAPPREDADLDDWTAYITDETCVRRWGIVGARLLVPESQWAQRNALGRHVALRLECVRRSTEATLAAHGAAIGRTATQWASSREICEIPTSVLQRMTAKADTLAATITPLLHLGASALSLTTIEQLLPLPESAIASPVTVPATPGYDYVMMLRRLNASEDQPAREIRGPASNPSFLVIDPATLVPGTAYVWELLRDDGDYLAPVGRGTVRTLTPARLAAWKARVAHGSMDAFTAAQFGLWNDALQAVWAKLLTEGASTDELLLAYRALRSAYEWLYRNATASSQVVLYRSAVNWVQSKL